jgi:hypothetical protein
MAAFNKFNDFVKKLIDGEHDFNGHVFKVYLTNATPDAAADLVKADLAEISAGSGYTAGGATTTITTSVAAGVAKITGTDVTFTAAGGSIGPARYAVLYNDTHASDALIGWWDYGSSVTLADTESLTVDFDATNGIATFT